MSCGMIKILLLLILLAIIFPNLVRFILVAALILVVAFMFLMLRGAH